MIVVLYKFVSDSFWSIDYVQSIREAHLTLKLRRRQGYMAIHRHYP